jgi:hypothetical protein
MKRDSELDVRFAHTCETCGKAFCCAPKGSRALLRIPSTERRGVRLCWAHSKPKGPKGPKGTPNTEPLYGDREVAISSGVRPARKVVVKRFRV